jgi:hypothetical protein
VPLDYAQNGHEFKQTKCAGQPRRCPIFWYPAARSRLALWLPWRSFYATKLIGLPGAGSGAVQRELARLAQSGLVTVHPVGNQKPIRPIRNLLYLQSAVALRRTVGLAEPLRAALKGL